MAGDMVSIVLLMRRENSSAKCLTRSGMSSRRSRKAGRSTGNTFRRKKRSARNFPSSTMALKFLFVAAIRRTLVESVRVLPKRSNSRSCNTRNSFGWSSRGRSPISSRNRVPLFASSSRPIRWAKAPVNAPFSWPNSSLSSNPVGIAAQLSLINVRDRRELRL